MIEVLRDSSEIAIRAEKLSKRYRLGSLQHRHAKMADVWLRFASSLLPKAAPPEDPRDIPGFIWALQDLSFEVKHGEALAVIGKNGAGKSVLLRILSRITEPTAGSVRVVGQVGSLLGIGAGFHPELTGRENIYLNGVLLGMRRSEIDRKFDDIVAFSEIEKFLDTAVKFYSSGMYMRLAFSVAAHMEPDILLLDEVLAVGDIGFRNKCLEKMKEAVGSGRTVVFVSHSMDQITQLCQRGLVLDSGKAVYFGDVKQAIETYTELTAKK